MGRLALLEGCQMRQLLVVYLANGNGCYYI